MQTAALRIAVATQKNLFYDFRLENCRLIEQLVGERNLLFTGLVMTFSRVGCKY